nr:hypothetical protein [Acetobacter oeni]
MIRRSLLAGVSGLPLIVAAAPGAYAAGMPQLDFKNPLVTGQVIWGGIIFLFFYLALRNWALPKVETVLSNRHERITGDLDQAHEAKMEADKAVRELNETKKAAAAQAQAHLDSVLAQEHAASAQRLAEINAKLETEIASAEANVAAERKRAMESLRPIASDVAESLIQRLTGQAPDRASVDAAIARASVQSAH